MCVFSACPLSISPGDQFHHKYNRGKDARYHWCTLWVLVDVEHAFSCLYSIWSRGIVLVNLYSVLINAAIIG